MLTLPTAKIQKKISKLQYVSVQCMLGNLLYQLTRIVTYFAYINTHQVTVLFAF